ncbi:MAG: Uma2 family endonuclease [Polyangiaceae bacterium]
MSAPQPLDFPSNGKIGVTKRRTELRILLYQYLRFNFAGLARVGCNQFMYWDPSDPSAWVAPDGFVCFGAPDERFDSWKVWERGVPDVAVEIVDPVDVLPPWVVESEPSWEQKLESYERIGVAELVRFEPDATERPLRVWDRVGERLVERELSKPCARSASVPGFWLALPDDELGLSLRLSRDEHGARLFPTPVEGIRLKLDRGEEWVRELRAELQSRSS